jgi:hypothetical protein
MRGVPATNAANERAMLTAAVPVLLVLRWRIPTQGPILKLET